MEYKTRLVISLIAILMAIRSSAQSITYSDLSYKYIFRINIQKNIDTNGINKNSQITLQIFNKSKKLVQQIIFKEDLLFDTVFKDNKNSRSYITGKNKYAEVQDYDFGDLVIADINFDGKEDIAVKCDIGGNGGPVYNFYVQNDSGKFKKDKYLTNYVGSFPRYIDRDRKTITTQIHANVHQEALKTFRFNSHYKKWRLIRWRMIEA